MAKKGESNKNKVTTRVNHEPKETQLRLTNWSATPRITAKERRPKTQA